VTPEVSPVSTATPERTRGGTYSASGRQPTGDLRQFGEESRHRDEEEFTADRDDREDERSPQSGYGRPSNGIDVIL
jgi:hypothetical protein